MRLPPIRIARAPLCQGLGNGVVRTDHFHFHGIEGEILLAVGPEGGWTEDELQLFQNSGWVSASLGPTILRSETAAIAATAIVISQLP